MALLRFGCTTHVVTLPLKNNLTPDRPAPISEITSSEMRLLNCASLLCQMTWITGPELVIVVLHSIHAQLSNNTEHSPKRTIECPAWCIWTGPFDCGHERRCHQGNDVEQRCFQSKGRKVMGVCTLTSNYDCRDIYQPRSYFTGKFRTPSRLSAKNCLHSKCQGFSAELIQIHNHW